VTGNRLFDYYDDLDRLVESLGAVGRGDLARALASAKRAGCTSGEVLALTSVELRKIAREPLDSDVLEVAGRLEREGSALWQG
jgi:hypothetical protein